MRASIVHTSAHAYNLAISGGRGLKLRMLEQKQCVPRLFTLQAVYFVKRRSESIKKDNFHDLVMFGDLSHVPLDHFSALIDTVSGLLLM